MRVRPAQEAGVRSLAGVRNDDGLALGLGIGEQPGRDAIGRGDVGVHFSGPLERIAGPGQPDRVADAQSRVRAPQGAAGEDRREKRQDPGGPKGAPPQTGISRRT